VPYSLREALLAFRRAPLLTSLSVLAIALSLFVVGLFGIAAHNIRLAIAEIESRVEVVAYFRDEATSAQIQQAQREIEALPEVLDVRFVSKTEALATAVRDLEEFREIYMELESNPLPASLEIRLREGHRSPQAVEAVAAQLFALTFVEDVRFGREWLERVFSLRRIAAGGAGILGGAFATVAAIIIATAIRIAVFARREEISIMRLVGATDGYIRRPYVLVGMLTGLGGGAVALGLVYAVHRVLADSVVELQWLPLEWIVAGATAGALLGAVASSIAVRRHMRDV
jgi:cell division transport system permease protein